MADSPMSRSLMFLRKRGFDAAVVEQTVHFPDKKAPTVDYRARALLTKVLQIYGVEGITMKLPALAAIQEELNPILAMFKRDLFNFCDILAVRPDLPGTLYVQTTTRDNQAARLKKMIECEELPAVIQAGNTVQVHGWAQVGPKGTRKLWKVSVHRVGFVNNSLVPVLLEDTELEKIMGDPAGSESDPQEHLFGDEVPADVPGRKPGELII
jgi:hypothetical protein